MIVEQTIFGQLPAKISIDTINKLLYKNVYNTRQDTDNYQYPISRQICQIKLIRKHQMEPKTKDSETVND